MPLETYFFAKHRTVAFNSAADVPDLYGRLYGLLTFVLRQATLDVVRPEFSVFCDIVQAPNGGPAETGERHGSLQGCAWRIRASCVARHPVCCPTTDPSPTKPNRVAAKCSNTSGRELENIHTYIKFDRRYLPGWVLVLAKDQLWQYVEEMRQAWSVYLLVDESTCVEINANMSICVSYITRDGTFRAVVLKVLDVSKDISGAGLFAAVKQWAQEHHIWPLLKALTTDGASNVWVGRAPMKSRGARWGKENQVQNLHHTCKVTCSRICSFGGAWLIASTWLAIVCVRCRVWGRLKRLVAKLASVFKDGRSVQ